jgi:hypothetical protein
MRRACPRTTSARVRGGEELAGLPRSIPDENAHLPEQRFAAVIDRATFDLMKERYGGFASWAVWAEASDKPKSNMGDIRVLDPDSNPALLATLRNDVVMVGLNISRPVSEPFRNFHDQSPKANDFKIRHAFKGTAYWGAYMTDFVKGVEMVESASLMRYLKDNPSIVGKSVGQFLTELTDLHCVGPTVLAFGDEVHQLIGRNVPSTEYSRLIGLPHYSIRIRKDDYRRAVLSRIDTT